MKKNPLTPEEEKKLVALLKKVRLPTSYPVFKALCKSVPMVAIDIAVMPDAEHILLTYRKDEFFNGWHIPGSILLYQETVVHALRRVIRTELKIKVSKPKFLNYISYGENREHGVALLFVVKPKKKGVVQNGKFFNLRNLPPNTIKVHAPELNYLKSRN